MQGSGTLIHNIIYLQLERKKREKKKEEEEKRNKQPFAVNAF